jgi:hypothetical protein
VIIADDHRCALCGAIDPNALAALRASRPGLDDGAPSSCRFCPTTALLLHRVAPRKLLDHIPDMVPDR